MASSSSNSLSALPDAATVTLALSIDEELKQVKRKMKMIEDKLEMIERDKPNAYIDHPAWIELQKEKIELQKKENILLEQRHASSSASSSSSTNTDRKLVILHFQYSSGKENKTEMDISKVTNITELRKLIIDTINNLGWLGTDRHLKNTLLDDMKILKSNHLEVSNPTVLQHNESIYFRYEENLHRAPPNQWKQDHLEELRIGFIRTKSIFNEMNEEMIVPLTIFDLLIDLLNDEAEANLKSSFEQSDLKVKADELIAALESMDANILSFYENSTQIDSSSSSINTMNSSNNELTNQQVLQHRLWKAAFMIKKYPNHESAVDSFIQLLLNELGFNDEWLYVFPKLRFTLRYKPAAGHDKESIPDFTVLHVISYFRMAVFEDKSSDEEKTNSEPQLIAQAISLRQANEAKVELKRKFTTVKISSTIHSKKLKRENEGGDEDGDGKDIVGDAADDHNQEKKENQAMTESMESVERTCQSEEKHSLDSNGSVPVIGLRVNGTQFYFYSIPISSTILNAMKEEKEVINERTVVKKLSKDESIGFDFTIPNDRKQIIENLGLICHVLRSAGSRSDRRKSK